MTVTVQYPDATLGAIVTGVDLANLGDDEFARIESLWNERAVLVFPGQRLSDEAHIAFSARFGRFERGLRWDSTSKLAALTNIKSDGSVAAPTSLQARFHLGNTYWHSDSSYKRVGAKASLLAAHVVPTTGGETEWADMRAAWDALPAPLQARLEDARAVHSYRYSHAWHGGLEILGDEDLAHLLPIEHPLMQVHPVTRRRSLFVGRHASHIVGDDEARSREFLKQLTANACQEPRLWKYRWQVGDIAIWDNRCTLHRGHLWPDDQARKMVRTTIAGDAQDNEWVMAS